MKPSLAIIGTGIAGMGTAYYLRNQYNLKLYEKNDYVGGHTNTVTIRDFGKDLPVDTGFMVFNDTTYPNLVALFDELGVEAYPTDMSFGVRRESSNLSFACSGISTFFAQRRRLFSLRHWRFLSGIKRFFESAFTFLEEDSESVLTLQEFVGRYRLDGSVVRDFLVPMASSIWSTRPVDIMDYPAWTLLTFMRNHNMLGIGIQFQWKTVRNGSEQYKSKLLATLPTEAKTHRGVTRISKLRDGAVVTDVTGEEAYFDKVVVATHADQALQLLEEPSANQKRLLGSFAYNSNKVVLHSDESVMPKEKNAWASWNFRYNDIGRSASSSIHYWMNRLQAIDDTRNYFVSVDYEGEIDPSKIHRKFVYEHPRFDSGAIRAQSELNKLNEDGPIYFCGSYFGYGFHEDALASAKNVSKRLSKQGVLV